MTPRHAAPSPGRRTLIARAVAAWLAPVAVGTQAAAEHPDARWRDAAAAMKQRAEAWGDQPYGAVLVLGGTVVGEGPSRVVKDGNPDAHAERVAIADAQRRLGRPLPAGTVLYSTSRPCRACEAAARQAGVARMIFGATMQDAGAPRADGA